MEMLNLLEMVTALHTTDVVCNPSPTFMDEISEEADEYVQSIFRKFNITVTLPEPLTYIGDNGVRVTFKVPAEGDEDVTEEFYGLLLDEFEACQEG